MAYTLNRVQIRKGMEKTPYELLFGHTPSVKYFKTFGRKFYIKRDNDINKFDPKNDEGMFLGYSLKCKAYKCFNYRTKTIVECSNVKINEKFGTKEKMMDYNSDGDDYSGMTNKCNELFLKTNNNLQNNVQTEVAREEKSTIPKIRIEIATPTPNRNLIRNDPKDQIIGSKEKGVMTRSIINEELCLIAQPKPKSIDEVIKDDNWVKEMEQELQKKSKNDTWELVPRPKDKNVIGRKWVFRNKMNKQGEVIRNKACKGSSQQEGIEYEETYVAITILEVVRMFLAYVANNNFKVYQMDVKLAFLNGELEEEVYIEQLEGFPLIEEKDMVCKLKKALYGLKKAPRTQYARLDKYLAKIGFAKGIAYNNLYLNEIEDGLLIIIVFVDDIIFWRK